MALRELLKKLGEIAKEHNLGEPFICGGVPRDLKFGQLDKLKDVDITTGREDIGLLADLFAGSIGASVRTFPDGHKQLHTDGIFLDFSTNFKYDNIEQLLAEVGIENPDELTKETFSRDFTINTLLMPLDLSETIDLTGMGLDDLEARILRAPLDARLSFKNSPNRLVRAFEYRARFDLEFAPELKEAIMDSLDLFARVSPRYAGEKFNAALRKKPELLEELIEMGIMDKIPHTKYISRELIKSRKLLDVMPSKEASRRQAIYPFMELLKRDGPSAFHEIQVGNLIFSIQAGKHHFGSMPQRDDLNPEAYHRWNLHVEGAAFEDLEKFISADLAAYKADSIEGSEDYFAFFSNMPSEAVQRLVDLVSNHSKEISEERQMRRDMARLDHKKASAKLPFMELMEQVPMIDSAPGLRMPLRIGGIVVSLQTAGLPSRGRNRIEYLPEDFDRFDLTTRGIDLEDLRSWLPASLQIKAETTKRGELHFGELSAEDMQELVDILQRHGPDILENLQNRKQLNSVKELDKNAAKEPTNHPYPSSKAWRRNYDLDEGWTKMTDDFRDGKIKSVKDFVEKKQKEPPRIQDLYEKRKKRKKKLKKKAAPQIQLPEDLDMSHQEFIVIGENNAESKTEFRFEAASPEDAFRIAEEHGGPGIDVDVWIEFYDRFRLPDDIQDGQDMARHYHPKMIVVGNDPPTFIQREKFLTYKYVYRDGSEWELTHRDYMERVHTITFEPHITVNTGIRDLSDKVGGRIQKSAQDLSTLQNGYCAEAKDYWKQMKSDSEAGKQSIDDFLAYISQVSCNSTKKPTTKEASTKTTVLVSVHDCTGPALKYINSERFSNSEEGRAWAEAQISYGRQVNLLIETYDAKESISSEAELKEAIASGRLSIANRDELPVDLAPAVQRSLAKSDLIASQIAEFNSTILVSKNGEPLTEKEKKTRKTQTIWWTEKGQVYTIDIQLAKAATKKINKLAVLRSDSFRPCPYGLVVPLACKNVGSAIHDMQPLEELPKEERDRFKQANRRVYRHSAEGEACPYLEGAVEDKDIVNCDWGDSNAGVNEVPFRPSPYYPRVFTGLGTNSLYSFHLGSYEDGQGRGQLGDGLFHAMYSNKEMEISKIADYYVIRGELEPATAATQLSLPFEYGEPANEVIFVCHTHSEDHHGEKEMFETGSILEAQTWALSRIGPGQVVTIYTEGIHFKVPAGINEMGANEIVPIEMLQAASEKAPGLVFKVDPKTAAEFDQMFDEQERAEVSSAAEVWVATDLIVYKKWESVDGADLTEVQTRPEEVPPGGANMFWYYKDGQFGFSQLSEDRALQLRQLRID